MLNENWLREALASVSGLAVENLTPNDHLMVHGLTSMDLLRMVDYFNDQGFDVGYADLYEQCSINGWLVLLADQQAAYATSGSSRE